MPISCVLSLPVHELNMWAEFFKAEYYDAHPDERAEKDCQEQDMMSYQAYALLGGDVERRR